MADRALRPRQISPLAIGAFRKSRIDRLLAFIKHLLELLEYLFLGQIWLVLRSSTRFHYPFILLHGRVMMLALLTSSGTVCDHLLSVIIGLFPLTCDRLRHIGSKVFLIAARDWVFRLWALSLQKTGLTVIFMRLTAWSIACFPLV